MVRQLGSAGCCYVVLTGTITVTAVSYGELSAMFPKKGGQYVYIKKLWKLIGFVRLEFLCRDTNRLLLPWVFTNLPPTCMRL
jgi:hypothetical protein